MMRLLFLATLACALAAPAALAQVARVLDVKGTALVERAGKPARILGAGELLDARDTVRVARDSLAVLEFSDRTRVTLRPNSAFRVAAYRKDAPERALLGLVKGGMRFENEARGTEFEARLCKEDCAQEGRPPAASPRLVEPVARVVEMRGMAAAARAGEQPRLLAPGASIYERDGIAVGANSYAVLVFRDGARVTLDAGSRLAVNRFNYRESAPREGSAHLALLAGSAQIWSGKLAEIGGDAFVFESAIGVIRSAASSVGGRSP